MFFRLPEGKSTQTTPHSLAGWEGILECASRRRSRTGKDTGVVPVSEQSLTTAWPGFEDGHLIPVK